MADIDSDLSEIPDLPPPEVIETLSYETIVREMRATAALVAPEYFSELRESDPALKLIEVFAYREMLVRARVNDAVKGSLLVYADETMLAHLGALVGIERKIIDEGPPPVYEDIEDWRLRIALASRTFSVAGPISAYEQLSLQAHEEVAHAAVYAPAPGEVHVHLTLADGSPAQQEHIDAVTEYLSADTRRPLTDSVTVLGVTESSEAFVGTVYFQELANVSSRIDESVQAFIDYCKSQEVGGGQVAVSAIIAALMVPGAIRVDESNAWALHPDPWNPAVYPSILTNPGTLVYAVIGAGAPALVYDGGNPP